MEFNVKNCLGPSIDSIEVTYAEQSEWFDEHVLAEEQPDGAFIHDFLDKDGEIQWVQRRMDQLEDLMNLTLPPPGLAFGCCGHDDEETDLMGLHHGRNK